MMPKKLEAALVVGMVALMNACSVSQSPPTEAGAPEGSATSGIDLHSGSGSFELAGGTGRESKTIEVYYHIPRTFSSDSPVLFVAPGAGRDAWRYRDVWVDASEEFGVLILSPHYSEEDYPDFWSYNLAGMLTNVEINEARTAMLDYDVSVRPEAWIFDDFDRVFLQVKAALDVRAETYDMFGHSAGGQLLHRFVMFGRSSMVGRVLAANSGWYTLPTFDDVFPYGLANSVATEYTLRAAFARDLVVLLGELDDENETRGELARTPEIDVQGISRIERGRYFHSAAVRAADMLDIELAWQMVVVPGVGHDRAGMSRAAAEYLYGEG